MKIDTWEVIKLQDKITPEVEKIMSTYNTTHSDGVNSALCEAMWIGMCIAKGWIEESGDD